MNRTEKINVFNCLTQTIEAFQRLLPHGINFEMRFDPFNPIPEFIIYGRQSDTDSPTAVSFVRSLGGKLDPSKSKMRKITAHLPSCKVSTFETRQ